ncbi:hypothetical protein HZB06_01845, partial [Candidatus Wolfebacteria bacterium]|nr:hypothetical protein [Candidatus Wolfebacteria bacterium]
AFAISGGIISALFAFIFHILVLMSGTGAEFLNFVLVWHPGATLSYGGAVIHAIWMFVYGFIGAGVFAWLYNKLIK